jgi:sulfur-oxidizing protein SoxX
VLILIGAILGIGAAAMAADGPIVPFQVENGEIAAPLTGRAGDAERGRKIAAGRQGNCLACHHMPIPEQQFHGDIGPDLAGVGRRLSEGALRLRLVDPKLIDPDSIMPAFHKVEDLKRVARRYRGEPILNAQQIEDVVAYLKTLKE